MRTGEEESQKAKVKRQKSKVADCGSRRGFLLGASGLAAASGWAAPASAGVGAPGTDYVSLNGAWEFRLEGSGGWHEVTVPHTWQVEQGNTGYMGVAWYRREFEAPAEWSRKAVRIEFEAVFHSAAVTVNGQPAGEHNRKGYTAFAFDISRLLKFGARNTVTVRVDNAFDQNMLPRGNSSDWAHDGGIYRPVQLLVTPPVYIERLDVDAVPAADLGSAALGVTVVARNTGSAVWRGNVGMAVREERTGRTALQAAEALTAEIPAGETRELKLPAATLAKPRLWHFDHPELYTLEARLGDQHRLATSFGVRRIEVKDGGFYVNGERVRLMGVERMAGSNPEFGMAEPAEWIEHDHADMKELNCVYTRVHWPQDRRVLDYCDRHGIFLQTEVPTWGPRTFAGMGQEPAEAIMRNGLEQLREMIARDRNHPCLFSWGLCNEIGGQAPAAYAFARRMYEEAKRLDPNRLATYASNSLQTTPHRDVSGLMDYVMWNEYYESWFGGTQADLARTLDEIIKAFPGKPIVISEYGWCACTPERQEGDGSRREVLAGHSRIFRDRPAVAGLIFFCYNDYRTHVGDKGVGALKQRVHGVVDLYGGRKPSFDLLRRESSPIESLQVSGLAPALQATLRTRATVPGYTLDGYTLRAVAYGFGDIPVERFEAALPRVEPGGQATVKIALREKAPLRIRFDVMRPTGFSAYSAEWKF